MSIYPSTKQILFLELEYHYILDAVLCYYQVKDNRLIISINDNREEAEEIKDYEVTLSYPQIRIFLHYLKIKSLPTIKVILHDIVRLIFQEYKPMFGYGRYGRSNVFTEIEFDLIVKEILEIPEKNKKAALNNITPFITFLEESNLNPIPTGYTEKSWVAKCPLSNGKHFIMVTTTDDEWGCGYCRKKGSQKDLELWIEEIRIEREEKERQSQIDKKINQDNTSQTNDRWPY
ncbi:hypothetical protein FRY74_06395 [Vicingus serpentipes]|uniref:Uncharacterized protein n=1 Tax=Vicingus serpentipes TaxID=1926625 RepID=A0A5C6RWG6_9FLAO|nr:hypothetical protein [Vicingus serpentipes]TXB66199.1 hypothetical protein FRY74_06395 [Vicingus serpentipes]